MKTNEEILQDGRLHKEKRLLKRPRNPSLGNFVRVQPRDLFPIEHDLTAGWLIKTGNKIKHGCLARTIRPDQTMDLSSGHIEV
jgi:hypothetical protein